MTRHDHDFVRAQRKATNVSLESSLVEEARRLGINLSRACEAGLASEIAKAHARQWQIDNAEALASSNDWVERHGLPLARHRQF
ncbi:type II toxin-antitoxin system CcdA family antitoxin [Novosphingobium jiangmenense]|uniref:Type II toxin-antitoxin system CcdA family antitoxin n=1 Tax=Novosphingobium jiangmenense TaxID=2791981 RepID=A0ABS0HLC2_9SPHN|nr:type II toxin-antitoxin system CcdA family antitoxin [Novosphingobium jiangmenense]MBF9152923.1 type II toxin-antitoxin system CcdA family antitoxin [Novosphingobium jiangmenense]